MEEEGNPFFYLNDDLESPMKLVDGSGRVDQTYAFDEFGNDLIPSVNKVQPFGFTGYQKEEVGGLYYAQARRYNPFAGRFVSEDIVKGTIIGPFTLNHYNYCWNNPLQLVDLNGMWPEWAKKAGNWIVDHKEDIAKAVVAGTIVIAGVAVTAATFGTGAGVFVAATAGAGSASMGSLIGQILIPWDLNYWCKWRLMPDEMGLLEAELSGLYLGDFNVISNFINNRDISKEDISD